MAPITTALLRLIPSFVYLTLALPAPNPPTPAHLAAAAAAALAPVDPADWTPAQLRLTDTLTFSVPLSNFTAARRAHDPPFFDWLSDNCSLSPDGFLGVDFAPACQRHDFGTRQYRAQGRMDRGAWERLAEQLERDLVGQCDVKKRVGSLGRKMCHGVAKVYKFAVWNADKFGRGWGVPHEKKGKKKHGRE